MDSIIKVRRSQLNQFRGFFNIFASMCDHCYRSPCNCPLVSEISMAKNLLFLIDNLRDAEEERFYQDNPAEEFLDMVEIAIRQGEGKPVRSENINVPCENRQRKARALKTLIKRNRIEKISIGGKSFYIIKGDDRYKKTNKKGECNGIQS